MNVTRDGRTRELRTGHEVLSFAFPVAREAALNRINERTSDMSFEELVALENAITDIKRRRSK